MVPEDGFELEHWPINLLLLYEASVDARDKDGITAIMYASYKGHDLVVRELLMAGADTTFRSKVGQTALELAVKANSSKSVEMLMNSHSLNISSLPLKNLLSVPVCGWMLSILRSHSKHKHRFHSSGDQYFSVSKSCPMLARHGLDGSILEIIDVVLGSSIDEVMNKFDELNFANRIRLKVDLMTIVERFQACKMYKQNNTASELDHMNSNYHCDTLYREHKLNTC